MKVEKKLITPQLAKEILKSNISNRRLRENTVKHYSSQMIDGNWRQDTGELIKISSSNVLLDGQHRLQAVIESNKPCFFHIAYDIPDDVFTVLDTGKPRGGADTLQVQGVKNYARISAIITSYRLMKQGYSSTKVSQSNSKLTNQKILETYNERPRFWQEVCLKSDSWYSNFSKIITISSIGSFYALFYDINEENADSFFNQLCIGNFFPKNDTIVLLSKKLIDDKISNRKITQSHRNAYIVKAWNSFRLNKKLKVLAYNAEREDYPIPV